MIAAEAVDDTNKLPILPSSTVITANRYCVLVHMLMLILLENEADSKAGFVF